MKNLKPNSIEWLEFARSIGATHWHTKGNFYKIDSGNPLVIYTQNGWDPSFYDPELLNDRDIFFKIDFSQLGNKPPEPDWTAAPEGANLFWTNKWTTHPWFKDENGKLYNFDGLTLSWVETKGPGFMPNEFIKRPTVNQQLTVPVVNQEFTTEKVASSKMEPTTWDGIGLPPIGICESLWNSPDEYYKVRVIAHDDGEAVFRWIDGPNDGAISSRANAFHDGYTFRPIQPIKSDRARWIELAMELGPDGYDDLLLDFANWLYDAGLAKLPD